MFQKKKQNKLSETVMGQEFSEKLLPLYLQNYV